MNLKIDTKIVLAFSGAIGTAFIAGAAGGITLYKKRKEFREWIDNKMYPQVKQIVIEYGPTALRLVIEKYLVNKPKARKVFLNLVDFIENGMTKLPKALEKELYKIKDDLPSVLEELEEIPNENK